MGRKSVGILTVLLLFALVAGWYYFTNESKYFNTSAFKAIPQNSAAIIRIQNFSAFSGKIKDIVAEEFPTLPGLSSIIQQVHLTDSLLKSDPASLKYLNTKGLTIFYSGQTGKNHPLFLMELSDMAEKTALKNLVRDYFLNQKATFIKRQEGKISATIYYWSHGPNRTTFCTCFYKGLFFASTDPDLVIESAKQLDLSAYEDLQFEKISKTASPNADLNIYLNREKVGGKVTPLFSETFFRRINPDKTGKFWAEIDIDMRSKEFLFNGFTLSSDSLKDFMGILLRQKPFPLHIDRYFPIETSFFLSMNLQNVSSYINSYEAMLSMQGKLEKYQNALLEPDTLYGAHLQNMIKEHCTGETALVFTRFDESDSQQNRYLVLRIQNQQHLDSLLLRLVKPSIPGKRILFRGQTESYQLGKDTLFKINQIPINNMGELVFGNIFKDIPTSFYTFSDSCLIMGNSFRSLETYLQSLAHQQTLDKSSVYREYTQNISQPAVIYSWGIPAECFRFFESDLNPGLYRQFQDQKENLQKIHSFGWQMGPEKSMIYNIGRISF